MNETDKIIESLSPHERKILPYLGDGVNEICKKAQLDKVSVTRALEYLQNKKIIELSQEKRKIVEIGVNGALYRKKCLPERRLLNLLNEKRIIALDEAKKEAKLSNDEFKVSIGVLKRKAMIELSKGNIILNANKQELAKKSLEEQFIENLPLKYDSLSPEQIYALNSLKSRKDIIQINEQKKINIKITEFGKELLKEKIDNRELIEQLTPALLKNEKNWKGKKFRRYDITSHVPAIYGGKRHFVNQ